MQGGALPQRAHCRASTRPMHDDLQFAHGPVASHHSKDSWARTYNRRCAHKTSPGWHRRVCCRAVPDTGCLGQGRAARAVNSTSPQLRTWDIGSDGREERSEPATLEPAYPRCPCSNSGSYVSERLTNLSRLRATGSMVMPPRVRRVLQTSVMCQPWMQYCTQPYQPVWDSTKQHSMQAGGSEILRDEVAAVA